MKHIIGFLILAATLSFAQPQPTTLPAGPGFPEAPKLDELKTYLGLTDAQLQQLTQLQTAHFQNSQNVYTEMAAKQRILYEQMSSETPNGSIAGEAVVAIANLRKQLTAAEKQILLNAAAVLTEAQKPKLQSLDAARKLQIQISQAQSLFLLDPGGIYGILPVRTDAAGTGVVLSPLP